MRILISEEGIKKASGHWYAYTDSIRRALIKQGHETVIAAHKHADEHILELLDAQPVIRYSRWDGIYNSPWALIRYLNVFRHNWRLYRDLAQLLESEEPFDHIFAGNNLVFHTLCWGRICKRFAGKKFSKLTLLFVQDAGYYTKGSHEPTFPKHSYLLCRSLKALAPYIEKGYVELAAETEVTARQYEQFTGFPIRLYNHPTEIDYRKPAQVKTDKPIRFACFGFARYEKGSDLFQQAMAKFLRNHPDAPVEFMLQWEGAFKLPDGSRCEIDPFLKDSGKVRYIETPLSGEGFARFLDDTDVMVMPYRWSSYYSRLSRVTLESIIAGIPTVYTNDTWLDTTISQYGAGVGFEDENADSLYEAIYRAFDNYPALAAEALQKRDEAAKAFSGDTFAKILMS